MERESLLDTKIKILLAFLGAFVLFLFAAHSSYAISTAPTNVQFRCTSSGQSTLTWSPDPAAASYSLRLHKQGTNWEACATGSTDGPNNACIDLSKSTTSRSFTTDPYGTYDVWIHSRGSDGSFGPGIRVNGLRCVPNCSLGSIPSNMKPGKSYSVPASFTSTNGELRGEIFKNNFSSISQKFFGATAKTGSLNASWTPSSSDNGVQTLYCRAWNDSIAECRPQNLVDGPPRYNCVGPNVSKTVCVDGQAPDVPTKSTLSCVYSSTSQNGTKRYKVGHYWGRVADVGCTGLSSSPYWSQLSTSSGFSNTLSGTSNTWSSSTTNISSSTFEEGTVVYGRVKSRDGLDNQSGWSATTSIVLNTQNCAPDPSTPVVEMCPAVQHCTTGGTTRFEYCGDCQGSGCSPGYRCTVSNMSCQTYPNTVFFFDERYNVPCSFLPQTPTPTPNIDVADKSVSGNLITNNKRADGQCDYGQWCKWTRNQTSSSDIQSNGDLKIASKASNQDYGSCWIQWVQNGKADGTFYRLRANLSSNFPSGKSFFQFETANTQNILNPPINTSGKTSIDWAGYLKDSNLPLSLKFCTWGTGTVDAQAILQSVSLIKTVPTNTPTPTKTKTPTPKPPTPTPTKTKTPTPKPPTPTPTTSYACNTNNDCAYCGTNCITKGTQLMCSRIAVTGSACICVSGRCTSVAHTATPKPPTPTKTKTPTPKPPTPTTAAARADLTVAGSIAVTPSSVNVGQSVNIKFTVKNIGTVSGPAVYSYTSQAGGTSSIATGNTCNGSTVLAPGGTCISSYNFTFPNAGSKKLEIFVDPQNAVVESNEDNNKFSVTVTVVGLTPTNTSAPAATDTPVPTIDDCPNFALGNATCDAEGIINNEDYSCWRNQYLTKLKGDTPSAVGGCKRVADFDGENGVTLLDFAIWRVNALRQSSQ